MCHDETVGKSYPVAEPLRLFVNYRCAVFHFNTFLYLHILLEDVFFTEIFISVTSVKIKICLFQFILIMLSGKIELPFVA